MKYFISSESVGLDDNKLEFSIQSLSSSVTVKVLDGNNKLLGEVTVYEEVFLNFMDILDIKKAYDKD